MIHVKVRQADPVRVRVLGTVVSGGGPGLPSGGNRGDLLIKNSSADGDAFWTAPASAPEEDNTLPITAAAVYTTIGNINALLAGI